MVQQHLRNISIYQTQHKVYLTGFDSEKACWKLLKFDRANDADLAVSEDALEYMLPELNATLDTLHHGNIGGLIKIADGCPALIGCFRWSTCYYLLLVTKARVVGSVSGAEILAINKTTLVPLAPSISVPPPSPSVVAAEARCRRLLSLVDLSKDFFFSYDWPLWTTVQQALGGNREGSGNFGETNDTGNSLLSTDDPSPFASDRVWNEHLTFQLRSALGHDRWTMPLIHGSFYQRRLSLLGRRLTLTVVARRSKRNAGTRYARRGVTEEGHVANDVDIEQIVEVESATAHVDKARSACLSSVVQVRGSVPLFWSQAWDPGDSALRPSIRMLHFLDPLFAATSRHFADLRSRFGDPIICLDLLRQSDRRRQESVLSNTYRTAVAFLNRRCPPEQRVRYVSWDMRQHSRSLGSHLLADLQKEQAPLLAATGIFATSPSAVESAQNGVVRTNCVDCLDRTNVGQFSFGLLALGEQLCALGVTVDPYVEPRSTLAGELMVAYEATGNALAEQYAGSEAHTGIFQRWRGDWHAGTHSRDLITTIRRFYSNAVTDDDKQQAINIFLGQFVPLPHGMVRSGSTVFSEQHVIDHGDGESSLLNNDTESSLGLPSTLSSVSLASSSGEGCDNPSLSDVLLCAASVSSGMLPPAEKQGHSQIAGVVGRKPRWVNHTHTFGKAEGTAGRPTLQSFDQVLPANVRSVRLSAPPVAQAAPPQSSWLSPRGLQRSTTATVTESGGRTSHTGGISSSVVSPPLPPPQRLVRSSSAGDVQSLTLTAPSFFPERAAAHAVRFSTNAQGPHKFSRAEDTFFETTSTRGNTNLLGKLVIEGHERRVPGVATLPSGSGSYHTLAGLNLEGAELPPALAPRAQDDGYAAALGQGAQTESRFIRRLSFASFANLRQLVMGPSSGAFFSGQGGSANASRAPSRVASYAGDLAGIESYSAAAGSGGLHTISDMGVSRAARQVPPLALESMLQQHQAAQHGIDDLGLPAASAALWLRPTDALRVLNDDLRAASAEVKGADGALLTPVEFAELERAAAASLRPTISIAPPAVAY